MDSDHKRTLYHTVHPLVNSPPEVQGVQSGSASVVLCSWLSGHPIGFSQWTGHRFPPGDAPAQMLTAKIKSQNWVYFLSARVSLIANCSSKSEIPKDNWIRTQPKKGPRQRSIHRIPGASWSIWYKSRWKNTTIKTKRAKYQRKEIHLHHKIYTAIMLGDRGIPWPAVAKSSILS